MARALLAIAALALFAFLTLLPGAQAVNICIPTCADPRVKAEMTVAEEEGRPVVDFDKEFPNCGIGKIDAKYSEPIGANGPNKFDALIRKIVAEEATDGKEVITPELVKAIMLVESGGNPEASSQTGARGLMQHTKSGAAYESGWFTFPPSPDFSNPKSIWCPHNNIRGGVLEIKSCIREGFVNYYDIVGCYYAGPAGYKKREEPKVGPSIEEHIRKFSSVHAKIIGVG